MIKQSLFAGLAMASLLACQTHKNSHNNSMKINQLFEHYWEDRMKLYPFEATMSGDNRYNNLFPNTTSQEYRTELKNFYQRYLDSIKSYNREELSDNDRISYDMFLHEMNIQLDGFKFKDFYLMPIQQFWGTTIDFPQAGSGSGTQPFKTVKDYDDFLQRIDAFPAWADTAIANMRTGMAEGYVLPKALTVKVIPQLKDVVAPDPVKSIFYGPIAKLTELKLDTATVARLQKAYTTAILEKINPAYQRLADFFQNEYLPKSRNSSGFDSLPQGKEKYAYLVRLWTTTNQTPDEIYETGLKEVARIRAEMEKIKEQTGFKGDLTAFFHYINTDKKFFPFKTPEEVLNAFRSIQTKEEPYIKKLFTKFPKTKFEIRQTEAFRAASGSAEYVQGTADGTRPGVFYVPILDAKKFNYFGMETLFAHEAIPGHHYQCSLQQENDSLPKFRRFSWYGAYGEGWALYTESLGGELGLYTDPYMKMGNLTDEIHRAIRLVVDVGLHSKGWSREKAIQYMMDNEAIDLQGATAEIERYMAIPGQALSYKIGSMKIRELRNKYQQQLGDRFDIAAFHDEILKDGCLPLDVLEKKMDDWAVKISKKS